MYTTKPPLPSKKIASSRDKGFRLPTGQWVYSNDPKKEFGKNFDGRCAMADEAFKAGTIGRDELNDLLALADIWNWDWSNRFKGATTLDDRAKAFATLIQGAKVRSGKFPDLSSNRIVTGFVNAGKEDGAEIVAMIDDRISALEKHGAVWAKAGDFWRGLNQSHIFKIHGRIHGGVYIPGKGFFDWASLQKEVGISERMVLRRLKAGQTLKDALTPSKLKPIAIIYEGTSYSINGFAAAFDLPLRFVRKHAPTHSGADMLTLFAANNPARSNPGTRSVATSPAIDQVMAEFDKEGFVDDECEAPEALIDNDAIAETPEAPILEDEPMPSPEPVEIQKRSENDNAELTKEQAEDLRLARERDHILIFGCRSDPAPVLSPDMNNAIAEKPEAPAHPVKLSSAISELIDAVEDMREEPILIVDALEKQTVVQLVSDPVGDAVQRDIDLVMAEFDEICREPDEE